MQDMDITEEHSPAALGELRSKPTPLESHECRLDRFKKSKGRSTLVEKYIIKLMNEYPQVNSAAYNKAEFEGLRKLRDELHGCALYLLFRHYFTEGKYKLVGGCTCKRHLLCEPCAMRRASKQLKAYHDKVNQVMSDVPDQKLIFVTLTIKNGDDLLERYNHLTRSLQELRSRRKYFKSGRRVQNTVLANVHGAVWTFETTNNGKGWHPHLHMLALVDKDLNVEGFQEMLAKEWAEISSDSYIVNAKSVQMDEENWHGAFREVFKYALKSNDMTVENQYRAYRALSGKRLIASIGSLYGVQVSEDLNDNIEEELKLLPYEEILYKYSSVFGYQQHESNIHSLCGVVAYGACET